MASQVNENLAVFAVKSAATFLVSVPDNSVNADDIGEAIGNAIRVEIPNGSDDYVYRTPKAWGLWLYGLMRQQKNYNDGKTTELPLGLNLEKLLKVYGKKTKGKGRNKTVVKGEAKKGVAELFDNLGL
jgi:hypothetical protein